MGEDRIDKAIKRNRVIPGSELEKLARSSSYQIFGTGESDDTDKKLDAFLIEQSSNPLYADSLENGPAQKPKPKAVDPHYFTVDEFVRVAEHGLTPEGTLK